MNRLALRYFPVWLAIGWLLIVAVIYTSLVSSGVPEVAPHSDKVGHFVAYSVLALWFSQLYTARARLGWAIAFVALGALLELLQTLTASRICDAADLAANAVGVLFGWLLGSLIETNPLAHFERWLANRRL